MPTQARLTGQLTLDAVLLPFGLDTSKRIKLVRHRDHRLDVDELYRAGQFEFYQTIQRRTVFDKCDAIISFIGRPGTHALFVGVYDIRGVEGPATFGLPANFPLPNMETRDRYRYELVRDKRFDALCDRLVIDWGPGVRIWVQKFRRGGKLVAEILPSGYTRPFPGFLDVVLRYDELVSIVKHANAHRDWHLMLKSVAAVYLILDSRTGAQYVGSAYGADGLFGRWKAYASAAHGGNGQLRALIASAQAQCDLQFSVLQTLPITLTAKEVIAYEVLHKRKLGTRAHGLNSN